MGRMRTRAGRRSGIAAFTLIELLAVLALVVLLLGMVVGASTRWGRHGRMRTSARNLIASLSLARQWAMTHGESVVFFCTNAASPARGCFVMTNRSGIIGGTNWLGEYIVFATNHLGGMEFRADGSCIAPDADWTGSVRRIVLRETASPESGLATTVTVFRLTGYAVQEE